MRHPKQQRSRQSVAVNDLAALLKSARNYLDITWEDPEGDVKLLGIIQRGMAYLDGIAGQSLFYEEPCAAQGLLFNYCRYERSGALHEFQKDYLHELLALQFGEGVSGIETPELEPTGEPEPSADIS